MKTKLKIDFEAKEKTNLEKLLENNNFRNNQNYVFSQSEGIDILNMYYNSFNLDGILNGDFINKNPIEIYLPNFKTNIYFLDKRSFRKNKKLLKSQNNFFIISGIFILIFPILLGLFTGEIFKIIIVFYVMYLLFIIMLFTAFKLNKFNEDKNYTDTRSNIFYNYIYLKDRIGMYYIKKDFKYGINILNENKTKTLSKQDKIGLDLLKSFYNFSHYNKTDYLK